MTFNACDKIDLDDNQSVVAQNPESFERTTEEDEDDDEESLSKIDEVSNANANHQKLIVKINMSYENTSAVSVVVDDQPSIGKTTDIDRKLNDFLGLQRVRNLITRIVNQKKSYTTTASLNKSL